MKCDDWDLKIHAQLKIHGYHRYFYSWRDFYVRWKYQVSVSNELDIEKLHCCTKMQKFLSITVLLSPTTFLEMWGNKSFIVVKCLLRAGRWAENLRSKQHRIDETFYNLVQAKFSLHCDLNITTFLLPQSTLLVC